MIVEEFDGPQPPAAVLDGLVAYVRALDAKACKPSSPITMAGTFEQAGEAAEAAIFAVENGDLATARVMLGSARSTLGRIDERLAGPRLSRARTLVHELDAKLFQIQLAIDRNGDEIAEAIDSWLIALSTTATAVAAYDESSLFNADRLKAALAR